jgi:hypothetical protein
VAALPASHIPIAAGVTAYFVAAAIGANWLAMPANFLQIFDGLILSLKCLKEFDDIHDPALDYWLSLYES